VRHAPGHRKVFPLTKRHWINKQCHLGKRNSKNVENVKKSGKQPHSQLLEYLYPQIRMMKKIALFVFVLACLNVNAQKQQWTALHEFRAAISQTYEPAAKNEFQPAKDSAASLVAKAKEWQASAIPPSYDAKALKSLLKKLVKDSEALQNGVKKNKADADIKTLISQLHETFQQIMIKCNDQLW
jgi:hypothetical protein